MCTNLNCVFRVCVDLYCFIHIPIRVKKLKNKNHCCGSSSCCCCCCPRIPVWVLIHKSSPSRILSLFHRNTIVLLQSCLNCRILASPNCLCKAVGLGQMHVPELLQLLHANQPRRCKDLLDQLPFVEHRAGLSKVPIL